MEHLEWWLEGLLLFVTAIIGILGNVFFIAIFNYRKYYRNTFHCLMLCLGYVDTLYLISAMLIFSVPLLWPEVATTWTFTNLITFLLPTAHITLNGSILLTMCLALERYITVCFPFFKLSHSFTGSIHSTEYIIADRWPARYYILPVCALSIFCNVPRFLELEVMEVSADSIMSNNTSITSTADGNDTENQKKIYYLAPTDLRVHSSYVQFYIIWFNLIFYGFIPYVSLVLFNLLTYIKLTKMKEEDNTGMPASIVSQREKEIQLSRVSLIIVAVFIVCHSIKWIPNLYELHQSGIPGHDFEWPAWIQFTSNLSSLSTTVNCAISVFIYFVKHGEFVISLILPDRRMQSVVVLCDNTSRRNMTGNQTTTISSSSDFVRDQSCSCSNPRNSRNYLIRMSLRLEGECQIRDGLNFSQFNINNFKKNWSMVS